jgi:uncharacterized protein
MEASAGNSALYTGWVRHRRFTPVENSFRYRLYMTYLDLAELPELFDPFWFWSARRPAPVRFRRSDYLGAADVPLDEAVRRLVAERTGTRPEGPIRLLTHLRHFGWCFNPVSFYYCFAPDGKRLESIVAEITNTPWDERHAYVLPVAGAERQGPAAWRFRFGKVFHVSPFMPMDMQYDWRMGLPGDTLNVHMENWRDSQPTFDATLTLRRQPITSGSLARTLAAFPLLTARVSALIYWQAARLALKRTPFFTHPEKARLPSRPGRSP